MRYILSPRQARELDARIINAYHTPGIVLMEHAAAAVVAAVLPLCHQQARENKKGRVCVFCGGGNNGGDGLAVLRQLGMRGVGAFAILFEAPEDLRGDAKTQYDMAIAHGLDIIVCTTEETVRAVDLSQAFVYVDALFGTGLSRPIQGRYATAIGRMNEAGAPIVAVDIPSGIDGQNGHALGLAVKADVTVTFQHKKLGHLLLPGRAHCGALTVAPLCPPVDTPFAAHELQREDTQRLLPPRAIDAHKGTNGRALLCAGSTHYTGAALLCGDAALCAGAGLLHVALPRAVSGVYAACPQAICHPVGNGSEWDMQAARDAIPLFEKMDAFAIGPGMGAYTEASGIPMLLTHALQTKKPLVIDADGLNVLAKTEQLKVLLHHNTILTPHFGEMARLLGCAIDAVADDPVSAAKQAANQFGCVVLLKGATTVIAQGGQTCLNVTGNPGLAKGGSGDVLTGIILALLAQKLLVYDAARVGAYLLGTAADEALSLLQTRALNAVSVMDALHLVMREEESIE
ncbi:MAG: NAD(P)H-hydrate dehydratase [Clostridiales bacterium]|jgi:NAD(P)H-hydrate epimerase|nr:NAD(P)H-hydrate dehydratase [Clostridiales bacterium]